MSARPAPPPLVDPRATVFAPMQLSDIADVAAVEKSIYTAPWTEGNFVDSLNAGYCAWTLRAEAKASRGPHGSLVGYFVLMAAVDEAHLLNVSVAVPWQGRGHGLFLLHRATALALDHQARAVILEVRPSNARALAVYRRFGFREHGLRRRYYPASTADQNAREDAIVMRLPL